MIRKIAVLVSAVLVEQHSAVAYENHQFSFSLKTPVSLTACMLEPPAPNHGVVLVAKPAGCDDEQQRPVFEVRADYNVPTESVDTRSLVASDCGKSRIQEIFLEGIEVLGCADPGETWPVRYRYLRKTDGSDVADYFVYSFEVLRGSGNDPAQHKTLLEIMSGFRLR